MIQKKTISEKKKKITIITMQKVIDSAFEKIQPLKEETSDIY